MQQIRLSDQLHHLARLGHVAGQGLLAGNAHQLADAPLEGFHDFFHVLDPSVVGSADPETVDGRIGNHLGNGSIGLGFTHPQGARVRRGFLCIGRVGRPDPEHIGIPDGLPGQDVELGNEAASDEADAESFFRGHGCNGMRWLAAGR